MRLCLLPVLPSTNAPFPELPEAALPRPLGVVARIGGYSGSVVRVSQQLLFVSGLLAAEGLSVKQSGDRVLVTAGADSDGIAYVAGGRGVSIDRGRILSPLVLSGQFVYVFGAGYVLLTSESDAKTIGHNVPWYEARGHLIRELPHKRGDQVILPLQAGGLPVGGLEVQATDESTLNAIRAGAAAVRGGPVRLRRVVQSPSRPRRTGYSRLAEWPKLSKPESIHTELHHSQTSRLPVQLLRDAGLDPEHGVHISRFGERLLVWKSKKGGPYRSHPVTKQFTLRRDGLSEAIRQDMAVVKGEGYLVITTSSDAQTLAPRVKPVAFKAPERLADTGYYTAAGAFSLKAEEILAWVDVKNYHSNEKVFTVSGRLWHFVGVKPGDSVRFFRYVNATVTEKCPEAVSNSRVRATPTKPTIGRHNYGAVLFPTESQTVRAIATVRGVVLCEVTSAMAQLCTEANRLQRSHKLGQKLMALHPSSKKHLTLLRKEKRSKQQAAPLSRDKTKNVKGEAAFIAKLGSPLNAKKHSVGYPRDPAGKRLQISGNWLADLGFEPGARYRIAKHPAVKGFLVELDDNGPLRVTAHSPSSAKPKIYVPAAQMRTLSGVPVRVVGTQLGLHVLRDFERLATDVGTKKSAPMRLAA